MNLKICLVVGLIVYLQLVSKLPSLVFLKPLLANLAHAQDSWPAESLDKPIEITVHSSTSEQPLRQLPSSASIVTERSNLELGLDHFQNVIEYVPNLNWAGGTSRPRFFQVRGIGELEQYEGAPNPSVGFIIDDLDFSGIGGIASLFDTEQVEILRGPQSIRYGANALAGVINLKSKDPTPYYTRSVEVSTGNDDLAAGGVAIGGPIAPTNDKLLFRLSAFKHTSDGFRENLYLNRSDTNKRDELLARAKLRWLPSGDTTIDLTGLLIDADNGYDAFAIDNSYKTQSDRPGADVQNSKGGSLRLHSFLSNRFELLSLTTASHTDIDYSYDGDWGNDPFWGVNAPYDYFSSTDRKRKLISQEFRFSSNNQDYHHGQSYRFLTGGFFQKLTEASLIRQYFQQDIYDQLDSDYRAKTYAVFGELEAPIATDSSIVLGLRRELRNSDYTDSRSNLFSPQNEMSGGNFSVQHDLTKDIRIYGLVSRGFKGGGFNVSSSVPEDRRTYTPEHLWNFEVGTKTKSLGGRLETNLAAFYMARRDQQLKLALQSDPNDPLTFVYITDNAARGWSEGVELDSSYQITSKLKVFLNGSVLDTKFTAVAPENLELLGRDQSHAPNWQYATGLSYHFTSKLVGSTQLVGKDGFYFDDSNNQRSNPHHLLNLALGYETPSWSLRLWGRNVLDKRYAVRGFYFGDEPPDFPTKRYVQLGDRAQLGLTLSFYF